MSTALHLMAMPLGLDQVLISFSPEDKLTFNETGTVTINPCLFTPTSAAVVHVRHLTELRGVESSSLANTPLSLAACSAQEVFPQVLTTMEESDKRLSETLQETDQRIEQFMSTVAQVSQAQDARILALKKEILQKKSHYEEQKRLNIAELKVLEDKEQEYKRRIQMLKIGVEYVERQLQGLWTESFQLSGQVGHTDAFHVNPNTSTQNCNQQ